MLSIDNLHAGCEGKTILQGINLDVKPGEVHAIMGPNGSGRARFRPLLQVMKIMRFPKEQFYLKERILLI